MKGSRDDRIQKLILQVLSPAVRELKDPEISGLVTLTDVKLTRDRKTAFVLYSVLGSQTDREGTGRALERSQGHLRGIMASKLHLKLVPALKFNYDPTSESADRIERILFGLDKEREDDDRPQEGQEEDSGRDPQV